MGAALVIVLVALGALAVGILVGRYYVPTIATCAAPRATAARTCARSTT